MEKQIIIVTTEEELERLFRRILESIKPKPETVLKDRIGIDEAQKLLECSHPTLLKYIKEGKVKAYGTPRKRYFFRSEIIEAVKAMYPPDYRR
jgi:hypothetical protein